MKTSVITYILLFIAFVITYAILLVMSFTFYDSIGNWVYLVPLFIMGIIGYFGEK